jgi:hypothetical protein
MILYKIVRGSTAFPDSDDSAALTAQQLISFQSRL